MRVMYFGTFSAFSSAPLRLLIEAGHDLCAVVVPAEQLIGDRPIALLNPPDVTPIPLVAATATPSIVSFAWEQHIVVYQVSRLAADETLSTLNDMQADVACVSCFSKRIPSTLLSIPRWGFLNIHPSLLPHYRGPYPLFWMLRHGDRRFGITIHFMDERLDTGDITAQAECDLPDGLSGEEIDRSLSLHGAELLFDVLHQLERGQPQRHAQVAGGSYFPAPHEADFVLDTAWSAQRAFNFMRGTNEWQRTYPIEVAGQHFTLKQALFYAGHEILDQPYRLLGNQIDIQFSPGVLRALIA